MDYRQLIKSAKAGTIPPVCYLYGEEQFTKDETVKAVMEALVDPATAAFNSAQLYAEEVTPSDIVNNAAALPMMAQHRVVLVRNFQRMADNRLKPLLSYLEKPVESTCLLLEAHKNRPTGKLFGAVKKKGWDVQFKTPYENQLAPWVTRRFGHHGLSASPKAVELLVRHIGADLRALDNEIVKIDIYTGERTDIDAKDVEEVVGIQREFTVFELCNALGNRELDRTLAITGRLLEQGEAATKLLFIIVDHFTKLWKVAELVRRGADRNGMAAQAGIRPYFMKDYLAQAKRFSPGKLRNVFKLLLETDYDLKRSYAPPRLLLEILVYKICARAQKPPARRLAAAS